MYRPGTNVRQRATTTNAHLKVNYNRKEASAWSQLMSDVRALIEDQYGEQVEFQTQMGRIGGCTLEFATCLTPKQMKVLSQDIAAEKGVICELRLDSSGSATHPHLASFMIFYSPLKQHKGLRVVLLTLLLGLMCYAAWRGYARL